MAVHSSHPAWPAPQPPERERTDHLLMRGWCTFVLFAFLAGAAWVEAAGMPVAVGLLLAGTAVSAIVWAVRRPPFNARRLPWFVFGYVLWAGLSVIWAPEPGPALVTWLLLAGTTAQGLCVAALLTWREFVRALVAALQWVVGLTLVFELAVAVFVHGPLLPGFVVAGGSTDAATPWSSGNLFGAGALQGLAGDADVLGATMLLAVIAFVIAVIERPGHRVMPAIWGVLAAFLLVRSFSVPAFLATAAVALVLGTVLLMRTVRYAGGRTKYYVLFALTGIAGAFGVWLGRDSVFAAFGSQPHDMWTEVFARTGVVGLILVGGIFLSIIWRAWFFAIDRPRWDLVADRPYSSLTVLPTLTVTILLVQGLASAAPLSAWGWMLLVALGAKITQAPLVGVGPAEQSAVIERGDPLPPLTDAPGAAR